MKRTLLLLTLAAVVLLFSACREERLDDTGGTGGNIVGTWVHAYDTQVDKNGNLITTECEEPGKHILELTTWECRFTHNDVTEDHICYGKLYHIYIDTEDVCQYSVLGDRMVWIYSDHKEYYTRVTKY